MIDLSVYLSISLSVCLSVYARPGLTIELPCDNGHIGQKLEPISVTFTVVFGILLMLQLVGMVMHRFSTLVHIVAATTVRPKKSGSASENYTLFGRYLPFSFALHIVIQQHAPSHPHSEHRFPAPSIKEGCRKPVLGVCLRPSSEKRLKISKRHLKSLLSARFFLFFVFNWTEFHHTNITLDLKPLHCRSL